MFSDFFDREALAERLAAYKASKASAPPPSPVVSETVAADVDFAFDPASFPFADRAYRIHFKNGCSGEYSGAVLAHTFPFDAREVERVEHVEDVGQ